MNYLNICVTVCLAAVSAYGAGPKPRAAKLTSHAPTPTAPTSIAHAASASRGTGHWTAPSRQELSRIPTVPSDKQENAQETDRTWTNDRLEQLHERGLISEFNRLPEARAEAASQILLEESNPFRVYDRLQDPRWYTEHVATLRAQIQALETELLRYQAELQFVRNNRTMEAGLAVYQGTIGITPEAGIDLRKKLLQDLREQLDELSDLARRNNIPPSVVRE